MFIMNIVEMSLEIDQELKVLRPKMRAAAEVMGSGDERGKEVARS